MRAKLSVLIDNLISLLIFALVALFPLVFINLTTEFFDLPKIILLSATVLILIALWSLKWVVQGKVTITRTPLDIPLLLFLAVILISTYLSDSRYTTLFGAFPQVHGSTISWVGYILLYFIVASNIDKTTQVKILLYLLLTSSVLVSLATIASYWGFYLPLPFIQSTNFTPTGSSFSTASLLIVMLPLLLISISNQSKNLLSLPIALAVATLFAITIALVGSVGILVVGLLVILGTVLTINRASLPSLLPLLLIPVGLAVVILILGYLPFRGNPFGQKRANFPQEIQLPFVTSWKVSASSFRDSPFFGTGPATYLYNFTAYKPIEHNSSRFWNVRFGSAFNEYLQTFGTVGLLGLLAFVFFALSSLKAAWRGLAHDYLIKIFSLGTMAALALTLVHSLTPVLAVVLFILAALLMVSQKNLGKVEELSLGIKASKFTDTNLIVGDVLPIILFIPIIIFVSVMLWNGISVVRADFAHRQALVSASSQGLTTYNQLIQAERLNPYIDLYRTDLAQTNFALANAIALAKRPTQASPTGSLTDQDRQNIRQLLSQAINEGRSAVALSPRSASNWEVLGSIYRQISGVAQNALQFALDSYGRAIQRDPLNPNLRLIVGGVYYSVRNFDLAIRFFTDSVNLKPDFANGYYNLSIALRDKGDLQAAQLTAERVVALLDPKSGDYQTASNYLADLKARIATGSAQQASGVPPAAEERGALQSKQLPNVLELPQPERIATPPAVRRNPQVIQPTPTPSPSPTP